VNIKNFNDAMKSYIFFILFALSAVDMLSQTVLPKPERYYSVIDKASLLKEDEFLALSNKLDSFERQTKTELVVVIIPELGSLSVEDYANQLFNAWGLGKKDSDNGILLLIAVKDRKMRIETGYGIEDKMPDIEASYILDYELKPNFKNKLYYEGIDLATNHIIRLVSKEFKLYGYTNRKPENSNNVTYLSKKNKNYKDSVEPYIVLFILIILKTIFAFSLLKYVKKKKKKLVYEDLFVTVMTCSIYYLIFSFMALGIFQAEKFYYSTINIILSVVTIFLCVTYYVQLLPKKTTKIINRLLASVMISAFISCLVLIVFYSFLILFILFITIASLIFLIFQKTNTDVNFKGGSAGGGTYSSSSYSSSSYSSSSYSDSSSGYKGGSYGGGSSGGGGASGSW